MRKEGFIMAEDKKDAQETTVDKSAEKKAADKGADKNAKSKGPGRGNRFFKFFRDTKGEFKKITWPTFGAVARNTGVTLAMCAFIGVIVCLFDFVLSSLINLMLSL
jgi:hypothetical protein